MTRPNASRFRRLHMLVGLWALCALSLPEVALAQPPASNPNEMCGDGTTFTVALPGLNVLPLGAKAPDDTITLPNGCGIYALFVSGYERNRGFDELTFYKVAKFVAEHNGYVHYAWWNNIMKEYMAGPAHDFEVSVPLLGTFSATPGGLIGVHGAGFVPLDFTAATTLFPKALPEEDTQFQADARRMLQAIRARNPDAIVIVAGHSMGGEAVARLGSETSEIIDLLAPIDPVGNRTRPVGRVTNRTYNWTRWRAAQASWAGFRQADCIRIGPFPLPCRDFDSRIFHVQYRCEPSGVGPLLDSPPIIGTRAPGICPGPWVDPGRRRTIRANVRHLLHRWQKETVFPFDYGADEPFNYLGTDTVTTSGLVVAAQKGLGRNGLLEADPEKTCSTLLKTDPRDPDLNCNPSDGHGEIVGFRGFDGSSANPLGVRAQAWPDTAPGRRLALIEMATAPGVDPLRTSAQAPAWPHEPVNPHLCMVSDDMLRIVQTILDRQPAPVDGIAPISVAELVPGANSNGWHNTDVDLALSASDEAGGSGVREIAHALTGAQAGGAVTPGDAAAATIVAEGTTTVQFHATDNAGNTEAERTTEVRIDRTPPVVGAVAEPPAANGWNRTDVTVSFPASDSLSGLASTPASIVVVTEGANQEITGTAEDNAGNSAAASAIVSIDRTAPDLQIAVPPAGAVYLLNAGVVAEYSCADTLSGVASCQGTVPNGAVLDTSSVGSRQFTVAGNDVAGNEASSAHAYSVQYDFSGFSRPVLTMPSQNLVTAGRAVPIKYSLKDASGAFVSDLASFVSIQSAAIACDTSGEGAVIEDVAADGGTAIRYDAATGEFHYNWKTEKAWAGSCRALELTLSDGTRHQAVFQFR